MSKHTLAAAIANKAAKRADQARNVHMGVVVSTSPLRIEMFDSDLILTEGNEFELTHWMRVHRSELGFHKGDTALLFKRSAFWSLFDVHTTATTPSLKNTNAYQTLSTSPPVGAAGGDLSGSYPNPSIIGSLRSLITNALQSGGAAGGDLSGTYPNPSIISSLRSLITNAIQGGAAAGGDLSGTLPNPSIAAALRSLITGALQSGGAAGGDLSGTYPNPSIATALRSLITGALQPGSAAGGDLAGTYPNPTIATVLRSAITNALQVGAAAGGDLSGTYPNPGIVASLRSLITGALQVGAAAGGDLSGSYPNPTIATTLRNAIIAPLTLYTTATWPPASPSDGQLAYFQADAVNGIVWVFRYRAGSSSSYKWEFVGGDPLEAEVAAAVTCGSGSTYAAVSGGPTITLPLAGDWMIVNSGNAGNSGNNVAEASLLTVKLGAAAAVDAEAISFDHPASTASWSVALSMPMRRTALAQNAVLAHYVKGVNNADTWSKRSITARPVRVQ